MVANIFTPRPEFTTVRIDTRETLHRGIRTVVNSGRGVEVSVTLIDVWP